MEYIKLNWKSFQELASNTESMYFNIDNLDVPVIHGIIGIQTEISELFSCIEKSIFESQNFDIVNFREELGDILWYISLISRSNNWNMKANYPNYVSEDNYVKTYMILEPITKMQINSGNLIDCLKKHIFYCISMDMEKVKENVDSIFQHICNLCWLFKWDIEEIMAENINKLKERYPENFTKAHSIMRLDKRN